MKVIWATSDIKGGLIYGKPQNKERWIIGYIQPESGPVQFTSVSLSDGLIQPPRLKEDIATNLTNAGYLPVQLLDLP